LIRNDKSRPVPEHLRNAATKLMKELGYGREYRSRARRTRCYAAGENYFPDDMPSRGFTPLCRAGLEAKIKERLDHLREMDRQAAGK